VAAVLEWCSGLSLQFEYYSNCRACNPSTLDMPRTLSRTRPVSKHVQVCRWKNTRKLKTHIHTTSAQRSNTVLKRLQASCKHDVTGTPLLENAIYFHFHHDTRHCLMLPMMLPCLHGPPACSIYARQHHSTLHIKPPTALHCRSQSPNTTHCVKSASASS
jgi:hypothetical protein